jgi:hypothetical protein
VDGLAADLRPDLLAAAVGVVSAQRRSVLDHAQPWLGWVGGALGWALSHQIGSNAVFDDCRVGTPAFVVGICLAGLLLALLGGLASLAIWRRGRGEGAARRFVGAVGALFALLCGFAILLQAIASLIVPLCLS